MSQTSQQQPEMPFALVQGEEWTTLPEDLYIPPDALEVILEAFTGPLDLLLYLIRRQNLDILDIPIAEITRQYIEYIQLMREMRLELAAEYLVMASILAEIKSRMLLPRPQTDDEDEEHDPRAELVRRLQDYERFKQAAEDLDRLPRVNRDTQVATAHIEERGSVTVPPAVELRELLLAMRDVMHRAKLYAHHHVERETLSVRERMSRILQCFGDRESLEFTQLFTPEEGRTGAVVTFIAVLELLKDRLIDVVQQAPGERIYIRNAQSH